MRRPEASRWRSSSITSFSRVRLLTRANSMTSSIGLVRNSSAPASSPAMRSARPSRAVTSTTGIWRVAGSSFSRRQTSKPSMPGIITSSSTMSGCFGAAIARAVGPSVGGEHVVVFRRAAWPAAGGRWPRCRRRPGCAPVMRRYPRRLQDTSGRCRGNGRPRSAWRYRPRSRRRGCAPRRPSWRRR